MSAQRKSYPKRNAVPDGARPRYQGRALFRTGDTRIKCRDCTHYATHEAEIRVPANPFKAEHVAKVPFCQTHAHKSVAVGELERIHAYQEFISFNKTLADWEARQRSGVQGSLV